MRHLVTPLDNLLRSPEDHALRAYGGQVALHLQVGLGLLAQVGSCRRGTSTTHVEPTVVLLVLSSFFVQAFQVVCAEHHVDRYCCRACFSITAVQYVCLYVFPPSFIVSSSANALYGQHIQYMFETLFLFLGRADRTSLACSSVSPSLPLEKRYGAKIVSAVRPPGAGTECHSPS